VDFTDLEIVVSQITAIPLALLGNTSQGISATRVEQHLGMHTIQTLEHVIGLVPAGITNQEILVSQTIIITEQLVNVAL